MGKPAVVFCTTCKGRLHHLRETLPRNMADNPGCKFVVLNYNSSDGLLLYLLDGYAGALRDGSLAVYSTFQAETFHMAHAKNMAHRAGILEGADILVNLDADNYTGPGFGEYLQSEFPSKGEMFAWARMVQHGPEKLDRGISGRIAVTRNAFLMAGGYDEKYNTWGPDDEDFKVRLRMLSIEGREIDARYLRAIRHPDKLRFREYRHVEPGCYGDSAPPVRPASAIANAGKVGLGKLYRNESGKPMEVRPIPTRIFGIGMHKTGTSSLHAAFKILGYNSAHWNTALWARAVLDEMESSGRSATLEQHYALSDLPFPLLYKQLDAAYPGSKFILTIRPEDAWLKSVEDHWNPAINPHRKYWDIAPFTHRIHQMLYGRKSFDAEVFLERYRRHNREVVEYFQDRPGDLLVLPIGRGVGFGLLCDFLGCPAPPVAFPHALRTSAYRVAYDI